MNGFSISNSKKYKNLSTSFHIFRVLRNKNMYIWNIISILRMCSLVLRIVFFLLNLQRCIKLSVKQIYIFNSSNELHSIVFKTIKRGEPYRSCSLRHCKFWHHSVVFQVESLLWQYLELLKNNTAKLKLFLNIIQQSKAKQSKAKLEIDNYKA